jgi:hypothetical protein
MANVAHAMLLAQFVLMPLLIHALIAQLDSSFQTAISVSMNAPKDSLRALMDKAVSLVTRAVPNAQTAQLAHLVLLVRFFREPPVK